MGEPTADSCKQVLADEGQIVMSAATLVETLIVAMRRNLHAELAALVVDIGAEIEPLTPERARNVAAAYGAWGKGRHPASLNFGDCFAYALAKEFGCPLLFVGADFSQTDITSALG